MNLLIEYKMTLKETQQLLQQTQIKLGNTENEGQQNLLKGEMVTIRSWISNLKYAIEWMTTCRQPGTTRGVENRAGYEREVSVDPSIIQQVIEGGTLVFEHEPTEQEVEREQHKERIVKMILKVLNKKERAVFVLAANQYTHREIAQTLNMNRSTVQKALARCKEKIQAEGWVML